MKNRAPISYLLQSVAKNLTPIAIGDYLSHTLFQRFGIRLKFKEIITSHQRSEGRSFDDKQSQTSSKGNRNETMILYLPKETLILLIWVSFFGQIRIWV
ncbi:hypothetical protein RchiOBHm_Chr6g0285201 [Rosa chinensis]|uniref:Uncharacterized protein n=1 Tax=Rosa chinensis TaxID=74649 RepID=A0A2P6PUH6_ROSCH|nr:hypothetical protein RchiOBHm_Chr6g0285201 [Rosa chinensis]